MDRNVAYGLHALPSTECRRRVAETPRIGVAQPRQHPAPVGGQAHMLMLADDGGVRLEHAGGDAFQGEAAGHP